MPELLPVNRNFPIIQSVECVTNAELAIPDGLIIIVPHKIPALLCLAGLDQRVDVNRTPAGADVPTQWPGPSSAVVI